MKTLIVDDDQDLLDVMTYAFRREGYEVVGAADGLQALDRVRADEPDIILLDLRLPHLNGFEVCRRIREVSDTPIIIVSGRSDERNVLRSLQLGADDFVVKPFSLKQLAARMEAVLRRCRTDPYRRAARTIRAGDLELSLETYEATRRGVCVELTPLEFRILHMLVMNEGHVIPYARLVDHAWGYDGGDANLLKTHICHIRQKLGLPLEGEGSIRALPTVGYTLVKHKCPPGANQDAALSSSQAAHQQAGETRRGEQGRSALAV